MAWVSRRQSVAGLGLALSSTAFALQILAEKGDLSARHGRIGFSILLFQDLAVIPMIALIPLLGTGADAAGGSWLDVVEAVAVIVAVVVGGRFILRPCLRLVAATRSNEIFTAAALFVVIGTAVLMELVGLSMALGAFLAGVLLADSEYRHELEADIEPFKGLLLGLFFIAVGMSVDLKIIVQQPVTIVGLALGLMAVKGVVLYGLGRITRLDDTGARNLSVTLPQGGEFAFVLFGIAVGAGVIERSLSDLLIVVVSVTMALTPFAVIANDGVNKRVKPDTEEEFDRMEDDEPSVIIAGFGRFGQIVGRVLRMRGIRFTALDASFEQIDFVRRFGNKVYFGDASRLDLLRAAGRNGRRPSCLRSTTSRHRSGSRNCSTCTFPISRSMRARTTEPTPSSSWRRGSNISSARRSRRASTSPCKSFAHWAPPATRRK